MVEIETKSDIRPAVSEFNDVLSEPVGRVAKFYTLYYISEEMGNIGVEFDMRKEAEVQADSFYNYSIYATSSEISNLGSQFKFGTVALHDLVESSGSDEQDREGSMLIDHGESARRITDALKDEIEENCPNEAKGKVKEIMFSSDLQLRSPDSVEMLRAAALRSEDAHDVYTDSETFLKASEFIFSNNWERLKNKVMPHLLYDSLDDGDIGWAPSYGGDAWASIPRTALLKDEFSEKSFIDLMWSVEHNNGNFIDKVPNTRPSDIQAFAEQIRDEAWEKGMIGDINIEQSSGAGIWTEFRGDVLNTALDFAKSGNIRPLFQIAKRKNRSLSNPRLRDEMFPMEKMFIEDERILNLIEEDGL